MGEVFCDLLKIHQKVKSRLVDGEAFILCQRKAPKKMSRTRGYHPPVPPRFKTLKNQTSKLSIASGTRRKPRPLGGGRLTPRPPLPQRSGMQGFFFNVYKGLKGKRAKRY